jgi:CBS domain containing-hemolysin-like protein
MLLLMIYVGIALGVSFLCSLVEAVLLTLTSAQISVMREEGKTSAELLKRQKANVSRPLAAVLSLNTIAHTMGAAGAGAQAAKLFGSASVGIVSAIVTLLVLVFSEIIPKTLGAHYVRQLAPATAYILKYMVALLLPLVIMSEFITRRLKSEETLNGFNRAELSAMADLGLEEGHLVNDEVLILKNLLRNREITVRQIMNTRTVLFTLSENITVGEFFHRYQQEPFTRIPVYDGERENITGYVIKTDLLLAQARGNQDSLLHKYRRKLPVYIENATLDQVFRDLVQQRTHIMLIVDEYGSVEGIVTMEDLIETLLGLEIVDEKDKATDMQKEASKLLRKKVKARGLGEEDHS